VSLLLTSLYEPGGPGPTQPWQSRAIGGTPRLRVQGWSGPTDLEASKVDRATPTRTTRSRLPSAPGIGPAIPSASPQCELGLDLGAHCINQARRQEDRCRWFERGASVGDRAVAGLVSRHGAAPWCKLPEPSNTADQDRLVARGPVATNQPSKIPAKGSPFSTRPTATRTGQPLARDTSTSTPGSQVDRLAPLQSRPVTLAVAAHSLGVSPDTCVLRRALVVPSTVCLRGSFESRERGGKWDDLRS
jgi:hypothetical protein